MSNSSSTRLHSWLKILYGDTVFVPTQLSHWIPLSSQWVAKTQRTMNKLYFVDTRSPPKENPEVHFDIRSWFLYKLYKANTFATYRVRSVWTCSGNCIVNYGYGYFAIWITSNKHSMTDKKWSTIELSPNLFFDKKYTLLFAVYWGICYCMFRLLACFLLSIAC